ncbi:MAG TPA: T9SS type A sorting domain-containing protein, partial [Bacteroidia bacterium]|nr:T9SS type A sorting domain-containing protein [Bacteroidia bacterium]
IQPGATLTINPGITLTICGDLNVLGTLIASPTSTILFNNGSVVQNITGIVTGANAVGNLTVTKTGGSVVLGAGTNIDIAGTFTTSNATSVFNTAGNYVKVAGNFVNSAGNTTFTNTNATGTLEFNGSAAQTYNQGTSQLDLNFVKMNHTGPGVTLQTNMVMKPATGSLTLTAGKIITGANEVRVYNTTPACVTIGNTTSYVEGYLRRWTLTGLYEFPVGEAVKGYERASVNFTANTNVNNLRANFVQYATVPAALGTVDCSVTYNMPALDDGKWIINAFDATLTQITGTCTYDMILYNRVGSYTNATGNAAWTIMKDPGGTGAWALYGVCNAASTLNATMRNGMSGFSHFGTAQSTTPLPVELLNFAGENMGDRNRLVWTTASETNNDYFTLERSDDGVHFSEVTRVDGAGTTTQQRNYEAFDNYPNSGYNYYRLKQTDFNGAFSYSGIVVMENKFVIASVENIHPNPSTGDLNFDLLSTEKGTALVEVMDITGRIVLSSSSAIEDGRNTLKVDLSSLAQGTYMLRVSMGCCNFTSLNKVIKE